MAHELIAIDLFNAEALGNLTNECMSNKLLSLLIRGVRLGSWCRAILVFWNPIKQKFEQRSDLLSKLIWSFHVCLNFLQFAFVVIRAVQISTVSDTGIQKKLIMAFYAVLYCLPVCFQISFIWFGGEEMADSLNNSLQLFREFRNIVSSTRRGNSRLIEVRLSELLLEFTQYGSIILLIGIVALNVEQPSLEFFLSSVGDSQSDIGHPSPLIFVSSGVTSVVNYLYLATAHLHISFVVPRFIHQALIEALGQSKHSGRKATFLYKQLFLNNDQYNRVSGPFILPMTELICIAVTLAGIVAAVRFHNVEGLAISSFGFFYYVILLVLLKGLARTDQKSQKLKWRWKTDCVVDRRTLKTLQPIRAKLGSYGFADTGLILTVTQIIISSAINILLVM